MTDDERRIRYLAGEGSADELDPQERADLDALLALVADPALWAEPSADLEPRVMAAVAAEQRGTHRREPAGSLRANHRSASRATRWIGPFLAGAAAAAAVVLGVTFLGRDSGGTTVALAATELAPDATGHAVITEEDSGLRIELHATGLPRREGTEFYQAWLRGESGLVPIGTFHTGDDVVLWAGVSLADFPTLTITKEVVGDQESSGERVLVGTVDDG